MASGGAWSLNTHAIGWMMGSRWRSMAVVVVMFTAMAVAMVWALSLQLQAQLRQQLLDRAEQRSLQLADAMSGQVGAQLGQLDMKLLALREQWLREPDDFAPFAAQSLGILPPGLVSHVSVADAQGRVVFSSKALPSGTTVLDRRQFQALGDGVDRMVVGEPVFAKIGETWLFAIGRPLLQAGRFDGMVYLLVSPDFLASALTRLTLSDKDVVALVHPGGRFLARTQDNPAAMTQTLPDTRPFLAAGAPAFGVFREVGSVDGEARLFGWKRVAPSGVMVVVGLSEEGVLAPLAHGQSQALGLTALLSAALALVGVWIGFLLRRLEQGAHLVRESRERLEEAQSMAHVGHWTYDPKHDRLEWSAEVYRIFGQDPARFEPSFERYWAHVVLQDRKRLAARFDQVMMAGADVDDVHGIVRPDGRRRQVRLLCRRAPDHDALYRGTLQDVTALHEAQQALEQLNADLEQRVQSRTHQLMALNRELESFTYSVSHDLRTPLRSIHGFAALLQEAEAERLSAEGRDFLRRIQDSSGRMGRLINDLLLMSRQSRAPLHPQRVDLSAMAQALAADLAREAPERQVQWDIEPGLEVEADPTLMQVVLQNLLGNAWKYTGLTAQARISLRSLEPEPDGQEAFCVSDNGAGFDMKYVDQLFQPFKRLHAHHEFEGTGIGLAMVARVVQRHGGRVRAQGAVGQGASFCFTLPQEPVHVSVVE